MSSRVCQATAIALTGIEGTTVLVEAAVSQQLPGMAIIGLPDTALAEAKQRVRLATAQAGLPLSHRFVTINLSPAALPKQGSGFDLAIALAALAASGHLPPEQLSKIVHMGELGLGGELRRPAGLLSAIVAAKILGFRGAMVPESCADEAALVPGIDIYAAPDLRGAVAWHRGEPDGWRTVLPPPAPSNITGTSSALDKQRPPDPRDDIPDMSDVIAQPEAVEALVVAAAGRHHISMTGPPGAGKTMLASRMHSILPDLSPDESITASSIASLGGTPLTELVLRPPFESPHHTASAVSIIGGGNASSLRPGAITRACHGLLFLDETPEFPAKVLDALRQPLESGTVEIHRARIRAVLPAQVQLVLASNPCPCGNADSLDSAQPCLCSPSARVRYQRRISGPLNDRIDIKLSVRRVSSVLLSEGIGHAPGSRELRDVVTSARNRAAARLTGTPWRYNSELPSRWLHGTAGQLSRADTAVLDRAFSLGRITMRGYNRALRVAWTLADIAEKPRPERSEIARALALREAAA
ncbi:MAG: YifB family Mg chelatase-like AAA ATPase [Leucobacter sp.]